jgi:hypothetical protein
VSKKFIFGVFFVLSIYLILASASIFSPSAREYWFDESFSLETVKMMERQDVEFRAHDVHPPTYYVLLHSWMRAKPDVFLDTQWARLFSTACVVLFLLMVMLSVRELFGEWESLFVGGMLVLCSTYLHYGTETRMYAFVLLLSSIVFYAVFVMQFKNTAWRVFGGLALFFLPLTHYFASMAVFFYAVAGYVWLKVNQGWRHTDIKKHYLIFVGFGILGIILALSYAIPQKARTLGTWFAPPSIVSWPSAASYAFMMNENIVPNIVTSVVFVLFLCGLILLAYVAFKTVSKKMENEKVLLLMMGSTIIFPALGLIGAPLLGGEGFAHLYHHRFFLVLTWMFAVVAFLVLFKWVQKVLSRRVLLAASVVFVVVACLSYMLLLSMFSGHQELNRVFQNTPCPKENDSTLMFIHESPFSSLPATVWARENGGCKWNNTISTNISVRMGNGGGYDVVPGENVFWNRGLPECNHVLKVCEPYYLVYAAGTIPIDGNITKVYVDDGVELWRVDRSYHEKNCSFVWRYNNQTGVEHTQTEWHCGAQT